MLKFGSSYGSAPATLERVMMMQMMRVSTWAALGVFGLFGPGLAAATFPAPEEPLAWDATSKEYVAKPGELTANFTFNLTNISPAEVTINSVRTSCGCTVARLPSQPWRLPPGVGGQIYVTTDLRGKFGLLMKYVTVDTSRGMKLLNVKISIPTAPVMVPSMDGRTRNLQLAAGDRQIVFKGECAKCHLLPAIGKSSEALYQAACGICHEAMHRATMVPDLRVFKEPPNKEYWSKWVRSGKAGTLMPAFAQTEGGPLSDEQIQSLVGYLTHYFPPQASINATTPYHDD